MKAILFILIFSPLFGALFHALLGRFVPRRWVETVALASVFGSFAAASAAMVLAWREAFVLKFFTWFETAGFSASMDVLYNPLSAIMALMVTFVSGLIHLYSIGYMREDRDYVRYFFYLNLFVFSMLAITLADNLVFLFLGWEGVGFCSYALIGFWYADEARATAGRKAFIVTRIGDVAFVIAIGLIFTHFGALSISFVNAGAGGLSAGVATLLGMLLLWSAVGKSAQLPLSVWLPDAMAGPTPVSALIHAATMVTAGVYLLMRLFPVISLSNEALFQIALIGVASSIYAALSALAQKDIKRVLAYSTISQLGYMFLAVGAGDIVGSMSYLLSHAFFKALLFLAAGCVIHALRGEQDIFRMGGMRDRLPWVFWLFLAGALCLGALPPTGGFLGKDRILLAVYNHPDSAYKALWALAMVASFLTSLYTFRLFFLVFLRKPAEGPGADVAGVPRSMVLTLPPLAAMALVFGYLNLPPVWGGAERLGAFLGAVPGAVSHIDASVSLEWAVAVGDGSLASIAVLLAYGLYGPKDSPLLRKVLASGQSLKEFFFSGWRLDRVYRAILVGPYEKLAAILWLSIDEKIVDNGITASGKAFTSLASVLRLWTTGSLSTYLRMILLGFTLTLCALAALFHYV